MEKIIETRPDIIIREMIKKKYSTIEKACESLEIGSRQALNNNLKRFSEREGTFKAFYKVIDELGYDIEFLAVPKIEDSFDDVHFEELMNSKRFKSASKVLDEAKRNKEIDYFKYLQYRNKINSQEEIIEGNYRTVVNLDEDSLNLVVSSYPRLSFSEKLNKILMKESAGRKLYEGIKERLRGIATSKEEVILDELDKLYGKVRIERIYEQDVLSFLGDDKKVWIELEDQKLYDATNLIPKEILRKLRFKNNLKSLTFGKVRVLENEILDLSITFEEKEMLLSSSDDD